MHTMILKVIIVTKEMYETDGESKYLSNEFAKSILQPFEKWEDQFSIVLLRCFQAPANCTFGIDSGLELAYELIAAIKPELFQECLEDSIDICETIPDEIRIKLKGQVQTINAEYEHVLIL